MTLSATFKGTYGPWAVVSGASAGIGAEFARQLAAAGLSVVLIARRAEKLHALSDELTSKNKGVEVKVIPADLTTEAGRQAVLDGTSSLDVGLLINNAGIAVMGSFVVPDIEAHQRMLDLNITAFTSLAHAFARRFVARNRAAAPEAEQTAKRAGMVMLSSVANAPMAYMSAYAATKAYVTALSVGMGVELADDRVDVFSLEPGAVETEMYEKAQDEMDFSKAGFQSMPAATCVADALAAFERRTKARHTPGLMNRVMMGVTGMLPQGFTTRLMAGKIKQAMKPELVEYKTE